MGLQKELHRVEDLPAEICINVDVKDGLTNGNPCIVKKLVWVVFENDVSGSVLRMKYSYLYTKDIFSTWTPILEVLKKITVGR